MRKLTTYVHAVGEGADGETLSQVFGPGDDVPEWAHKAITNPDVWDGEDDPEPVAVPDPEPPRHGKGSGLDAWRTHAEKLGVEVEDDMTRDDIIAAVDLSKE